MLQLEADHSKADMTPSLNTLKKLITSAALCCSLGTQALAAPVTTFTFEYTVNAGPNSVGLVFQRTWTVDDFLTTPKYFDFGGGNGMNKVDVNKPGAMSASPFEAQLRSLFPTLPPADLDLNLAQANLYAELGYYTPGGTPQQTTGQLTLNSTNTKMHATGAGDYFYDSYQLFMWTYQQHELENLTPEVIADWWTDAGTFNWKESASRAVCATPAGQCTNREELYWSGKATLLGAVTVDVAAVPEPGTVPLMGLALGAVWVARRRNSSSAGSR